MIADGGGKTTETTWTRRGPGRRIFGDGPVNPASNAQALTAVLRVLAGLGPEPRQEEDALAEVELRGLLMHGVPPRTPGPTRAATPGCR